MTSTDTTRPASTSPASTSPASDGTVPDGTGTGSDVDAVLRPPVEAAAEVAHGALLVDVRSAGGRAAHGEIPGSTLLDRTDLDALFGPAHAPVISIETPVVVVCGSENGSRPVAEELAARGYTVSHVDGGFPAWKAAGLPAAAPVDPS